MNLFTSKSLKVEYDYFNEENIDGVIFLETLYFYDNINLSNTTEIERYPIYYINSEYNTYGLKLW